ncbi:hypothetical protein DY000_02049751 [Brassica cretica]|uniref:Uncharacterized protein n=1 Tax=Brassica cretica TaxID=69181 RepID=A0ABQ7EWK5_BRACR|nr:hypothetical protein DY000_02049751 [Brassica cretica]
MVRTYGPPRPSLNPSFSIGGRNSYGRLAGGEGRVSSGFHADANNKVVNTRATINYVSRHVQHDRTERPRATEDSQKTISDTRVSLETGECAANRGASTCLAETEEEKSRRLKGKAVATDSPTSKNTAELIASANRSAKLIISEPSEQPQHNSAHSKRYGSSPLEHSDKYMDLEMSQVRDLDIPLTEVELAEVDNLILETERLEMDENMLDIDNDDPFGDSPDLDAEKNEAISQLSPANAHDRTERPRATEDSQKTISDTCVSLETGECAANRGASTSLAETEEEKSRRLKGKAVATDSPTSKNTAELIASANRSAKLIISEPSEQPQHNSARSKRYGSSPLEHSDKYMDLEMSQVRDLDIPLTEVELAEAISQLSPANAVITKAAPPAQLPLKEKAVLPPHEPTTEAQPPYVPKGLLKKKSPRSPDIKGSNASKKLQSLLSRASPKKKMAPGKKQSSSSTMVPHSEVFPSASRKKTLSLSGSVVSQKPPSKKI